MVRYRAGTLRQFDVGVSFHSIEHSGLGRYGDGINPWGDVISVAKISCVVKPKGLLFLGLPATELGPDLIYYNAHRVYGPLRWPIVLTNWCDSGLVLLIFFSFILCDCSFLTANTFFNRIFVCQIS